MKGKKIVLGITGSIAAYGGEIVLPLTKQPSLHAC